MASYLKQYSVLVFNGSGNKDRVYLPPDLSHNLVAIFVPTDETDVWQDIFLKITAETPLTVLDTIFDATDAGTLMSTIDFPPNEEKLNTPATTMVNLFPFLQMLP